jgi:signal transduction histidine kinase
MNFLSDKSLGFRLLSAFIVIIVIVLSAYTVFSIFREERKARQELTSKGELMVKLLANSAQVGVFAENRDQLKNVAAGFAAQTDVVLVGIYNAEMKPLYLSNMSLADIALFPANKEQGNAATIGRMPTTSLAAGPMLGFSSPVVLKMFPNEERSLYFGETVAGGGERVIGHVQVVLGQESLNRKILLIVMQNAVVTLIFIAVSAVFVYLRVKKITMPLETLTRNVKALGDGGKVSHVPVETMDEIGKLAKTFNTMLDERRSAEHALEKILMDLHDGIGGITTNISMLSEVAQKASRPEDVSKALATISNLSREGMGEIRSLMYSLDQRDLNWSTLIVELKNRGVKTVEPHHISFEMTTELEEGHTQPVSLLCLHLFRIYHEALTNVIKHSKAKEVMVNIQVKKDRLVLVIQDDGVGCSETVFSGKGRGVANIRSRAEEIGGFATITGDQGTCLFVEIPLSVKSKPAYPE